MSTVTDPLSAGLPEDEPESLGRDFRFYAAGQAVSIAGDRVALIALVFLVLRVSHSYAPAVALFYIARALPSLVGGLVAGVLVDHFHRKRIMVGADLGRAILLALVPLLAGLSLWAVYAVVLVLYSLTLLFNASARAALPDLVPESRLLGANAILNSIDTAGDLFYIVGGSLVVFLGTDLAFYVDGITFLFSAAMVSAMRVPSNARAALPSLRSILTRIHEGIRYLFANPFLRWASTGFTVAPLAGGGVVVLTPLYASHSLAHSPHLVGPLHDGVLRFSVLEVTLGVGALLGGVVTVRLTRWLGRGALYALGMTLLGLCYSLLAFTHDLYVAAAITAGAGFFSSLFVVTSMTLIQTLTPSELRGRVVTARVTLGQSALALGAAAAGPLLLVMSYGRSWLLLGGTIVLASLIMWLRPEVRGQP